MRDPGQCSGSLIIAGAVTLANIGVHSIAMAGVDPRVQCAGSAVRGLSLGVQLHLIMLMITPWSCSPHAARMIEVAIWALGYGILGVVPDNVSAFFAVLSSPTKPGMRIASANRYSRLTRLCAGTRNQQVDRGDHNGAADNVADRDRKQVSQ